MIFGVTFDSSIPSSEQEKREDPNRQLANHLLLRRGTELLLNNAFAGISYIALASKGPTLIAYEASLKSIDNAVKGSQVGNLHSILFLFYPLAHEIGHSVEGQRLCPSAIQGTEILDTYAMNYKF